MNQQEYPYAVDCAWIASDGQGFVGVFITAGEGPVPAHALRGGFFPVEEVEARVLRLSIRTGQAVTNLCDAPDPGSYIALAQRGVFVYDWTDFTSIKGAIERIRIGRQAAVADRLRRSAERFARGGASREVCRCAFRWLEPGRGEIASAIALRRSASCWGQGR
jgi:hypothetical protein